MNAAKLLKLYRFPIPNISNEVGRTLTDSAARIIQAQCTLFTKEKYDIAVTLGNGKSLTNTGTQRAFEVTFRSLNGKDAYLCNCDVHCSFGIPCRHILALRQSRQEVMYSVEDVLPCWIGINDGAGGFPDVFGRIVEAAVSGRPNEDVVEVELDVFSNAAGAQFNELGVRFTAGLDLGREIV